ncbi:MAG: peptidyl-prolyl cis-trans isomerase [Solirubrobacterales bacterium]
MIFGVTFIVLFAIVAISEGIGDPSVPSGDAALVEDVPGDIGHVSEDDVAHAIDLAAAQAGEKKAPKPGDPKYDETKKTAMQSVLEGIWIQGVADEWGIEVTDAEVAKELKKVKKESFKSEAEFQKFLEESRYTPADIDTRIRIQILSTQLQEQLKEKAPTPSQNEIENYYEAAKSTQFTQKPSRDVRLIVNKDRKKTEEALDALSGDNSEANWKKVAKEFSEDPTTKASGGLQKGVAEGVLEEPLNTEVFAASEGVLEGPTKAPRGFVVFEVSSSTPESVQELKAVESQIQSTLTQQIQQEYFANFVSTFSSEWTQRTFCADDYLMERCANFEADGRPASAPEGCYEADPPGGRPAACPAPVSQLVPAMPGTITPLAPRGEPLAQRPRPLDEPGAGAEEAAGLPEGVAPPPTGAPPAE